MKAEVEEIKKRLVIVETLLSSLVNKGTNANKEGQKEAEGEDTEDTEVEVEEIFDEKFKDTLVSEEVEGEKEEIQIPSLIKRVKKEPRLQKASQIVADSAFETGPSKKKMKIVGTSQPEESNLNLQIENDENLINTFLKEKMNS